MTKSRWELEWEKEQHKRFYRHSNAKGKGGLSLQFGKYRGQDEFDKHMGTKYNWHDKFYVNTWHGSSDKTKLFKTKVAAQKYVKKKFGLQI